MKRIHYTYAIVNTLNGKTYIGAHSTNKIDDYYFGSGVALRRAIKKYGKENFKKMVIEFYSTEEELYKAEAHIVDEYYINLPWTYNMTVGGYGGFNHINSDPILRVKTNKAVSGLRKGKPLSEETKRKISENLTGRVHTWGDKISTALKGKKKSEEHKRNNREAQMKPIFHKTTGISYKSFREAAEALGVSYAYIKDKRKKLRHEFENI